jgi:hypothetical protein
MEFQNFAMSVDACDDLLNQDNPIHPFECSQSIRAKSAALLQMAGKLSALLEEGKFDHNMS